MTHLEYKILRTEQVLTDNIVRRSAASQLGACAQQAEAQKMIEACVADLEDYKRELVNA